jgi:hypothetical protein
LTGIASIETPIGDSAGRIHLSVLSRPQSVRFDVRQFDHFAPLLGFIGDELAEIGGQAAERRAIEAGKPRFELGLP